MNRYQKAIRYTKPLVEIDEKIRHLNERMVTTGMYTVTNQDDGIEEVPPTFEPAPLGDFSDLDNFNWDGQGDGSSSSANLSQLKTPDVDDIEQLVLSMPDLDFPSTAYAMAFGPQTGLTGNPLGYVGDNGFVFVYTINNVFSVPRTEFQDAFVKAYESGSFVQKGITLWNSLLTRPGGVPVQPTEFYPAGRNFDTNPQAERGLYSYSLLIPTENGNIKRNNIKTDDGVRARPPRVNSIISRNDLGDPNYYAGNPNEFLMGILNVGKSALDYLLGSSDDFLGDAINSLPFPDIPVLDYGSDIASSIAKGEPIYYSGDQIPQDQKNKLVNNLDANAIGNSIPVVGKPVPYADDNFKTDTNGNVSPNTGPDAVPNTTSNMADDVGIVGVDNPLAAAGKAQGQVVVPTDGSTPYFRYTDHAYYNSDSTDPNEVPGIKVGGFELNPKKVVADKFQSVGKGMEDRGYPPNIKGDVVKTFDVPLPQLPIKIQKAIQKEVDYQKVMTFSKEKTMDNFNKLSKSDQNAIMDSIRKASESRQRQYNARATMKSAVSKSLNPNNVEYKDGFMIDKDPMTGKERKTPIFSTISGRSSIMFSYEPSGKVLTEGWESPKHTNIEKDMKKRFFDPKDIAPEYPKEPPAPMVGGYSSKSKLAPKENDKELVIKITKKDLLRNHRLTKDEVQDMMDTINKINKFLAANPGELIHAQIRYPKDDPRLAELNWKMDQQLAASDKYIEKQFPENQRLFDKITQATKKTIALTDPKTFKDSKPVLTYGKVFGNDLKSKKVKESNLRKKSASRFFKKEKKVDTSRTRWLKG